MYEVKDADGSFLGLFYADYFPRAGKRGGAWMSNFREQAGEVRPLIYNVASFTKPAGNMPSLLTLDEVETMFHEFGHALHGMLTKCNYKGVSGTSVAQDFVELVPQQTGIASHVHVAFLSAAFSSSTEGSSPSRYAIIRSSSNSQIFSTSSV